VQRKGNLLDGFEAHDLRYLFRLNGRKLDESREARLTGDADSVLAALLRVPLDESRQGGLDQFILVVAGVGEDGFMLDDVEIVNLKLISLAHQLDGLERSVPDIDPPCEISCHGVSSGGKLLDEAWRCSGLFLTCQTAYFNNH